MVIIYVYHIPICLESLIAAMIVHRPMLEFMDMLYWTRPEQTEKQGWRAMDKEGRKGEGDRIADAGDTASAQDITLRSAFRKWHLGDRVQLVFNHFSMSKNICLWSIRWNIISIVKFPIKFFFFNIMFNVIHLTKETSNK